MGLFEDSDMIGFLPSINNKGLHASIRVLKVGFMLL